MIRYVLWGFAVVLAAAAWPPQWYPDPVRRQLTAWFGASAYRPLPASAPAKDATPEPACPEDLGGWRRAQTVEGVRVAAARTCVADNPFAVAAFVRGTNNVSQHTLHAAGLTADAVEKSNDRDGDGDPDDIHIRLEVAELNGGSPVTDEAVTRYDIAPGITPGLWVFAPKFVGMAVENFESQRARDGLRLPSPVIRIEQGDTVRITLENTHYMPHTLHLHGADHGFVTAEGSGNDGVPITSELPLMPGFARTYELTPRQPGTMFYHCHVQPHVHAMMGLQGLFVIEPAAANNQLQTLNVGAGLVRSRTPASRRAFDHEYDLHYQDIDIELASRLRGASDARTITRLLHHDYDITDASADYFTLNGRSFPYTFREALVVGRLNERIKLRVVNGGMKGIALHTHGHKFLVTHRDGAPEPDPGAKPMDVVWLATSQRAEITLNLTDDGLGSYGAGIWPFHDHQYQGVTTDGIGPGGNISAIVYTDYIGEDGWPKLQGVSWDNYFTSAYYRKEIPIWEAYAPGRFGFPEQDTWMLVRVLAFALAVGLIAGLLVSRRRMGPG